ncbi:helix-turn-helix domain-containing protein [Paractinoplanes toevensis]|uniref:helix-turn-helix domain-containing protein n=1 Tax=Paractinoplanes toevensis TaxID=571911 RepID=UPI001BB2EE08|nr:helix-turn-helix domain-containing protein [Actinoplanes toevensis]
MGSATAASESAPKMRYTVDEAAALLGVSARWLADECRAERVEHVRLARHRFFTHDLLLRLLASREVKSVEKEADRDLERIMRRLKRRGLTDSQR